MMTCLAPWAFGAVEAWAECALDIGVALIALLGFVAGRDARRSGSGLSVPSLALIGLGVLAMVQAAALPERVLAVVSPATAALRAEILPKAPDRVLGDSSPPVPLPAATIAEEPETAIRMAMRLAAAWLLFQGVMGLEPGYASLRRFGLATAVNATLMALFSLIQMLTWNGKIYWYRPSLAPSAGPFVSHSHLSAYLNLGMGFVAASLLAPGRSSRATSGLHSRLWAAYAAGILLIGILASLSRNGFVSMVVAMVVLVAVLRPRGWQLLGGLAGVGVLAALLVLILGDWSAYQDRIATLMGSDAYQDRAGIWKDGLRTWLSCPVLGVGLGSFPIAMSRFGHPLSAYESVVFGHAENEYLQWLAEGGVVGLGLFLILIVGVAVPAWRALGAARSAEDRVLILGGIYGGVAILVEGLGDFALHIPGVAVPVVILAAHLTRLGLAARAEPAGAGAAEPPPRDLSTLVSSLTGPILGVVLVVQGLNLARSEAAYLASGRPWPGRGAPLAPTTGPDDLPRLRRERDAIARALALRPAWAEGYQELGLVLMDLYQASTQERLRDVEKDPARRQVESSPRWLHAMVHAPADIGAWTEADLLARPPVRAYLIPAVRSFLRARQYSPFRPLTQLELATLDGLLLGADPAPVLIQRFVRLCGANASPLALAGELAVQIRDLDLLARILRKQLGFVDADWIPVADLAASSLPPERILSEVVPDGRYAVLFAERLYQAPESRTIRERFLHEALRRLPNDRKISPAARRHLEARAWRGLDDQQRAAEAMEQALVRKPRDAAWRKEYVEWLIAWGKFEDAHGQALIGLGLSPDRPEARQAMELANDALARQGTATEGTR